MGCHGGECRKAAQGAGLSAKEFCCAFSTKESAQLAGKSPDLVTGAVFAPVDDEADCDAGTDAEDGDMLGG